jgi:hypothetical protein
MRTRYLGFVALVSLAPGLLFGCGADSQPSAEEARAAIREAEEAQSRIEEQIAERALTGTSAPGGGDEAIPPSADGTQRTDRDTTASTSENRSPDLGGPVARGTLPDGSRWSLHVNSKDGGLCDYFQMEYAQGGATGGGGCDRKRPMDFSGGRGGGYRYVLGPSPLASTEIKVEFEDGSSVAEPPVVKLADLDTTYYLLFLDPARKVKRVVALGSSGAEISSVRPPPGVEDRLQEDRDP